MRFFWVGDKLVNLDQIVWFDRSDFKGEIRLSSGDLLVMKKADFEVVLKWISTFADELEL